MPADGLDLPTPCGRWSLRQLLDHSIDSLTMFADALGPVTSGDEVRTAGATSWDRAMAELAARSRRAWAVPGVMDQTFELPIGTMPAPMVASAALLELVVHGWDIGQATGDLVPIPDDLAIPILEFAQAAIPAERGDLFAADLGIGDTPGEQLVAFLGRKTW
jgi:uncharacterized protein (TIGR03086 family)